MTPEEILDIVFERRGLTKFSESLKDDLTDEGIAAIEEAIKEYVKHYLNSAMSFEGNGLEISEYLRQLKNEIDK